MNSFTVERATDSTLPDAYALHPDRADAEQRLAQFRERMAAGQTRPEQFVLLRSERGVEGVVLIAQNPQVPLIPRARADTPGVGLTQFFALLHEVAPERTLLLDSGLTELDAASAMAAGWTLDDEQVMYETDLTARTWALAPDALEGGAELLERPEVAALLAELGQADWEMPPEWIIVALPGADGQPVALGAVGSTNRPGWASINMIGVRESEHGQGLGTRLHAHLLARAAERFTHHAGRTEASNHAMRQIFERNGSEPRAQQLYFRSL